jgi:hypothetical protein
MHAEHADASELNELSGSAYEVRAAGLSAVKATGLRLCLLLNFGKPRLEIKRVAHGVSAAPDHLHC